MNAADDLMLVARVSGSLVVVLVLAAVLARAVRRGALLRKEGAVRVLHRTGLSREASVAVVEIGDRALLLGVTSHQVSMLAELDPETHDLVRAAAVSGGLGLRRPAPAASQVDLRRSMPAHDRTAPATGPMSADGGVELGGFRLVPAARARAEQPHAQDGPASRRPSSRTTAQDPRRTADATAQDRSRRGGSTAGGPPGWTVGSIPGQDGGLLDLDDAGAVDAGRDEGPLVDDGLDLLAPVLDGAGALYDRRGSLGLPPTELDLAQDERGGRRGRRRGRGTQPGAPDRRTGSPAGAGRTPPADARTLRRNSGSVLSPTTWRQGIEALRDLTIRRG